MNELCVFLELSKEDRCLIVGNLPTGLYFAAERLQFQHVGHVWVINLTGVFESKHVDHVGIGSSLQN